MAAPDPSVYSAGEKAWADWVRIGAVDESTRRINRKVPPAVRMLAMLSAWWTPLRCGDQVYVTRRTTHDGSRPDGGVVERIESGALADRARAQFAAMCSGLDVASSAAVHDAARALAGGAQPLSSEPFLRWGRSKDGALWWDPGDEAGAPVRVTPKAVPRRITFIRFR